MFACTFAFTNAVILPRPVSGVP